MYVFPNLLISSFIDLYRSLADNIQMWRMV